jgi:ELWxxDGT repeat protein
VIDLAATTPQAVLLANIAPDVEPVTVFNNFFLNNNFNTLAAPTAAFTPSFNTSLGGTNLVNTSFNPNLNTNLNLSLNQNLNTGLFNDSILNIDPGLVFDPSLNFDPGLIFVPPPLVDTTTIPGTIRSSSPNFIRGAAGEVYFSATDASSGFEPWLTNGTGGGTQRLADIAAGSGSSYPYLFTALGNRVLFAASGQLWVTQGTPATTERLTAVTGSPFEISVVGDRAYVLAGGKLWLTNGTNAGTRALEQIQPDAVPLTVSVLEGEGDRSVSTADRSTPAAYTYQTTLDGTVREVSITDAIRAALAAGETRVTVRLEITDPRVDDPLTFNLAGTLRDGQTASSPATSSCVSTTPMARSARTWASSSRWPRRPRAGSIPRPTATESSAATATTWSSATRASTGSMAKVAWTPSSPSRWKCATSTPTSASSPSSAATFPASRSRRRWTSSSPSPTSACAWPSPRPSACR